MQTDPKHTSKLIVEKKIKPTNINLKTSHDLSLIEHLWMVIKSHIHAKKHTHLIELSTINYNYKISKYPAIWRTLIDGSTWDIKWYIGRAVCIFSVYKTDPVLISEKQKRVFLVKVYVPASFIPRKNEQFKEINPILAWHSSLWWLYFNFWL